MPALIELKGCDPCPLRREWPRLQNPKMPLCLPEVQSPYRIMAIGEGPGATEDAQGKPFVGETGAFLRSEIPVQFRRGIHWQNVVRCRPPNNATPSFAEVSCCSTFLEQDIEQANPQAILAIGDPAIKYFWPESWISGMRGIPFPVKLRNDQTAWCMGIFHPSYVLRSEKEDYETGIKTNAVLPVFRNDLLKFFASLPELVTPPKIYRAPNLTDFIYPKTYEEAINLFERLADPYAFDVETHGFKPYMRDNRLLTAAFSDGKLTFAFPVDWPGYINPWGKEAFNKMMLSKKKWIAENSGFEYLWVWWTTGIWDQRFDDIESKARLIHQRKGVGSLDKLSRIYLGFDIKALSNLDKNRLMEYPVDKVLQYNALDSWSTFFIDEVQSKKMSTNDWENYNRIITTIQSITAMEVKGLDVDLAASEVHEKRLYLECKKFDDKAREVPEVKEYEKKEGRFFSLSAPQAIASVLVSYCGIPLPKTDKNNYTTDEAALTPLAGRHPLIDIILDSRQVEKLKSTYVDPILQGKLLGIDSKLHPSYKAVRVATYRLSSEGPNIQNFPKRANKEIRNQIISPPGYILVAFDYGQLEGRVIAMFSKDPNLQKAFIEDDDIHWKWLYRIIELYPQYMDRLAKISGETKEKNILKAGRTIIKTDFVFASFYGSQAKALANRTQIPLMITEQVLSEFWGLYTEAKKWVDGQFNRYQSKGSIESLTGRLRNEVLPGNEPANSPAQGSAAEIVLEAQNALFIQAMATDINLMPRINVHDDILFVLPEANEDELELYIRFIGSEIVKPRFDFISVPLMTECRAGKNWAELESITNFVGDYYK